MTLATAWLAQPVMLALLCAGCGLALSRALRLALDPGLLVPAGLAVVIVIGGFATLGGATARLTAPAVVAVAIAGWLAAGRSLRPSWLGLAAAAAVFAVYAAPIVASGQATFAGYIKLDDTATWMALTDRVMEHGRSVSGLPPSTYEAVLSFNLAAGYPVGALIPLGVAHALLGTDVAWLIQPYMAFCAAALAAALWSISGSLPVPRALRAGASFLGAQAALLYGYYLWGGVKEIAAAALVATAAALAARSIEQGLRPAALAALAVTGAALVDALAGGGLIWLAPPAAFLAGYAARAIGARAALAGIALVAAATAALAAPQLAAGLVPPTSSSLTSETAQGNLLHPLAVWQLAGVWPAGDFRLGPEAPALTGALIAVAALAAALGIGRAWRARAWAPVLYAAGAVAAGLGIFVAGSPWIGAKALAIASPALPFAAALGAAGLRRGGGWVAALLLAALAAGVLWSNALAYRDVSLAPRDQLAELEAIGARIAGRGPALMTEYQPYGVRHFLRAAAPEGASELRRHLVPLRGGGALPKGASADTDRFRLRALLRYRTLVLRRSPAQSRPPSPYRLAWRGRYYEVWERPPRYPGRVAAHLGLGSALDPGAVPRCGSLGRLARRAGPGGHLLAVPRRATIAARLSPPAEPGSAASATVRVARAGRYEAWLAGSVRSLARLSVDGEPAGSARHQLENRGEYVELARVRLAPGVHALRLALGGADLHPGSGEPPVSGPLVLSRQDAAGTRVLRVPASRWRALCGRRLDWAEAVRAPAA